MADPASAATPVISGPVVASFSPGNGLSVTVAGSGFLGGYFPQIVFSGSLSLTITLVDINNPDYRIKKWTDDQILVDNIPEAALTAQIKVKHFAGESTQTTVSYLYDWISTFDAGTNSSNASPLALAMGTQPTLWINQEFHTNFLKIDLVSGKLIPLPSPGGRAVFELNGSSSPISGSGESVVVDAAGKAWFSESGAGPLYPPSPIQNHSRIVRYDPAAPNALPLEYNIPGDDNRLCGLALDPSRGRIWYASGARQPSPYYSPAMYARIGSFDPKETTAESSGIASMYNYDFPIDGAYCTYPPFSIVGTCSTAAHKQCLNNADCILATQVCAIGSACNSEATNPSTGFSYDANVFHEYRVMAEPPPSDPPASYPRTIGHMLLDGTGTSRALWYTVYDSWPHSARIGRLDPSQALPPTEYPLKPVPQTVTTEYCLGSPPPSDVRCTALFLGASPWEIAKAPSGDIVFTEHFAERLGRFDITRAADSACQSIVGGVNPCINEVEIPAADPTTHYIHSIAYDKGNNLWFTMSYAHKDLRATVGFLKPDWSTFVMLPALSAFELESDGNGPIPCDEAAGENVGVMATGMAADPVLGDMWFGEYCRKRVGRIRDASGAQSLPMNVTTNADDAWEDNSNTSPSKPKVDATTLQLSAAVDPDHPRSIAAFRLRTAGGAYGKTLVSHLTMPINSIGSNRDITLRVSVGVPNDSTFNASVYGDISNRVRLASFDVPYQVTPSTTSISIDAEITRLLDVAQRDSHWLPGQVNHVPFYVWRTDTLAFGLNLRSHEHSSGMSPAVSSVRGGS